MTLSSAHRGHIAVTGASGFVGRQALSPLVKLGFTVHALSRNQDPAGSSAALGGETPAQVHFHRLDLSDRAATRAWLHAHRPSHLLHFAWYAEHGKFWSSPLNVEHLANTLALLEDFADAGGQRFIGAGTCAEYDWSPPHEPAASPLFDEALTPLRPATLYGSAKASAFMTGLALARTRGIQFAWGRIFHLFGAGENPARIVPALIRTHVAGGTLNCSQGTQSRDFLPVQEVASAFAHLAASEVGGAVNIGSGTGITLREISALIASHVATAALREIVPGPAAAHPPPRAEIRFGAFHDSGPDHLIPRIERLRDEVGWKPQTSLSDGLARMVEWFRRQT